MSQRLSKEELDEQFEQFLKESLSDESIELGNTKRSSILDTLGKSRKKEVKKRESKLWWATEDDSDGEEILGKSRSFLKSHRVSLPIAEVEEEEHGENILVQKGGQVSISISRDSLETNDSIVASGPGHNIIGFGMDTLEEQEEKDRFFANLEKGTSSTIDYSRLNKELDSTDSTPLTTLMLKEQKLEGEEVKDELKYKTTPGDYSEDFEEEVVTIEEDYKLNEREQATKAEENSNNDQEEEKSGMLAKVVLLDSLDSTMGAQKVLLDETTTETPTNKEALELAMMDTGISYGQTNSDIEALHQAYCKIEQATEDTDCGQRITLLSETGKNNLIHDVFEITEDSQKCTSATDSDLPTVEDLMKPLRGDSTFARGFDLQPVSGADTIYRKLPLINHHSDSITEEQRLDNFSESHRKVDEIGLQIAVEQKTDDGNKGLTSKVDDLVKKIQKGTERKHFPNDPSLLTWENKDNQAFEHPVHLQDNVLDAAVSLQTSYKKTKSFQPKSKKSHLGPYSSVKSSGYGKIIPLPKQSPSSKEKQASNETNKILSERKSQNESKSKQKGKSFSTHTRKSTANESEPQFNGQLITSMQSFATYLQHQIDETKSSSHLQSQNAKGTNEETLEISSSMHPANNLQRELTLLQGVEEAQERWSTEHSLVEKLKSELLQKEKELHQKMEEMRLQHEKEAFRLKQEIYVLQTKVNGIGETNERKWTFGDAADPITEEKLKKIQKEVEEQEILIQGYHQENEKLYKQVKDLKAQNKQNEEKMFKENQHLAKEAAVLKEKIDNFNALQSTGPNIEQTRNQNFTELLSELRGAQKEIVKLMEEVRQHKQDKQALVVDLEQMKKERDLAKAHVVHTSGDKTFEMKIMEENYKQEIARLNKRLQWYAENQELLDKDAARLKNANSEIEKLKEQVGKLTVEVGDRNFQQQKRLKDRAADAKRIQDLERQVKEMEEIIRRRHPNSLPALIYAAASASTADTEMLAKPNTVAFLERRIKKLETDLEGKDEEAKKSLRTMEQHYQKMKIQYEQRISELESLLAHKLMKETRKPDENEAKVKALEEQFRKLDEAHQITENNLRRELESVRNQLSQTELKLLERESKSLKTMEQTQSKAKIEKLSLELAVKSREVQELSRTVERLQKERKMMLFGQSQDDRLRSKPKSSKNVKKESVTIDEKLEPNDVDSFPGTQDEKLYQPNAFASSHISDVVQENEFLKTKVERLCLEMEQQRVQLQAARAQAEGQARRTKEDSAEHISALKAAHQRELEKILTQHALEHSSSKVAELSSKVSTQEIMIKHLRDQVNELQRDRETLVVLRLREETLQTQVTKLLEELREAKESHSPEMKHFLALERKLKNMELRRAQREQELQQITRQSQQIADVEQIQEVEKWKKLAQLKNQELESFRLELDSILDVLRELQRQGVVLPTPNLERPNFSNLVWKT
ncbi:centrosomal protein of 162 kDa isoform X2 [Latimeria chalumnae]|uniref:Centrosomal protein of 162 kDa n=1 Tax=Latimeria chalumnae TaxID=7897 RepID=M3XH86_LATCH|nr:PREDICTED: centrosomal protein of 162 kDa isoform X2 [Latimeria chalumnae]|eukprot:XP_005995113.1 PREDICTED: centrosomal protein of 162 kDa isoform X2 [Latimeria chalumnae]